jgi:hypothetical protein
MKDINQIKELLNQANNLIIKNIDNAHNIDLEDMSQSIEDMIYCLVEIEDFEVYEDFED